jgi:ribosome biogenesis GTPase
MTSQNSQQRPTGRIIKRIGDRCSVYNNGRYITCAIRQKLVKRKMVPAVGDWVWYTPIDETNGVIEDVLDRGPSLTRTAAGPKPVPQVLLANLDLLVIVSSLAEPDPNPRLIDRFLVMAEFLDIPSVIVWNKIDLLASSAPMSPSAIPGEDGIDMALPLSPRLTREVIEDSFPTGAVGEMGHRPETNPEIRLFERYRRIGYAEFHTCALTGQGLDALRDQIAGKTSMFLGASGVGKTSLLNQLSPDLGKKVAEISHATGKGIHTTSSTEIIPLNKDTFIADSPGVREFALWGVARRDLGGCFREFQPFIEQCRFRDCAHDQEVDCGVKRAVEQGEIDRERWESYLRILHTL